MSNLSRRQSLFRMGLCGGFVLSGLRGKADARPDNVLAFMDRFSVPGLSLAIAKDGKIVRQEAYGLANLADKEKLTQLHRFRIASISKPVTSVAVFLLVEQGKLDLDSPVFGEKGILRRFQGPEKITVRHLLNHTSGGWKNDGSDPMFRHPDWEHEKLIKWTLENAPPKNAPGEAYAYSNFGYCLLGRVIEKVSGEKYEDFVLENVLKPCGVEGMKLATKDRQKDEVEYYTDGKPVAFKMNVRRMDAHGGWVGTPEELVKFALRVDGFESPADILKKESVATMTERKGVNTSYACGWSVNKAGNYWHGGSLPGLNTLLVRTSGGYCWAACVNTRTKGIGLALDRLMWGLVRS